MRFTSGRSTRYDATVASWTSAPAHKSADMMWHIRIPLGAPTERGTASADRS